MIENFNTGSKILTLFCVLITSITTSIFLISNGLQHKFPIAWITLHRQSNFANRLIMIFEIWCMDITDALLQRSDNGFACNYCINSRYSFLRKRQDERKSWQAYIVVMGGRESGRTPL